MPNPNILTRRAALRAVAAAAALLLPRDVRALRAATHPDPRPGVTGDHVLDDAKLRQKAAEVYRMAREVPGVFDGLHCYCECHKGEWSHRSLLSCFESMQPDGCHVCQQEARLAFRLHKEGKTLDEIREAVDKQFS